MADPDLVIYLTTGAWVMTSLFGMITMAVSGVAVSMATIVFSTATVSSAIYDSSGLATLTIGIVNTTDIRTTTDTPTIILIITTDRFTGTGIRAISPWWYKLNLPDAATITVRLAESLVR